MLLISKAEFNSLYNTINTYRKKCTYLLSKNKNNAFTWRLQKCKNALDNADSNVRRLDLLVKCIEDYQIDLQWIRDINKIAYSESGGHNSKLIDSMYNGINENIILTGDHGFKLDKLLYAGDDYGRYKNDFDNVDKHFEVAKENIKSRFKIYKNTVSSVKDNTIFLIAKINASIQNGVEKWGQK